MKKIKRLKKLEEVIESEKVITHKFTDIRDTLIETLLLNAITKMTPEERGRMVEYAKENKGFDVTMTVNGVSINPQIFFERLQSAYTYAVTKGTAKMAKEMFRDQMNVLNDTIYDFEKQFKKSIYERLQLEREE